MTSVRRLTRSPFRAILVLVLLSFFFAGSAPARDEGARALTPLESLAKAVCIDTMMAHLERVSTGEMQTRYYRTTGMQRATQYALDRFVEYGCDNAYFDTFTYNGYTIRNVIGVKTGATDPSRIYMVCGHLDSTSPQHDTLAPGAEDNGTGAMAVLEAARLLCPVQTDATIYFVCFTAEEQGMVGSNHLAAIAQQEHWDLRGVLNMDMVGYDIPGGAALWIEGFHANAGSVALMDLLESVANTYTDMAVYRYPGDGWGSDHEAFDAYGFPAILAIDYDWDSYACYHQTCDVIANVVPNQYRRMVVAVTVAGAQLASIRSALGSIAGTADRTDSDDDSGILLEIAGTGYDPVLSGTGGAFEIPDLLPGTYTLRATAQGYATADTRVTVLPGQATNVVVRLDPLVAGGVRGTIVLQGGGIPSGARIFAEGQSLVAYAESDGDYELDGVYPGPAVISAVFPGRMPVGRTIDVPSGQVLSNVDFFLESLWTFEATSEGLTANAGWQWGNDSQSGAHSGAKVWGTKLGTSYENCADYRLDLPPLDLRFYTSARLHFWQWYRTQAGVDGGNVQVSTDSGATWAVVPPAGGYPGQLSGSCNPLAGQPGYTGTAPAWTEEIVDLTPYAGRSLRVRYWFGSNGSTTDRGWYLDDFSLEGTLETADVAQDPGRPSGESPLSVLRILPNPFATGTSVRFRTARPASVWASIFDASGRTVRSLADDERMAAGDHTLAWDGKDARGGRAPAGTYWVRVSADGRTRVERITVVR